MTTHALENERLHLASLLEAIQRCVYFLAASDHRLSWPLTAAFLNEKKNIDLFETLAAHDDETEYTEIAEHFNSLHTLIPTLYGNASRFLNYCATALDMSPSPGHFVDDFVRVMNNLTNDVR